ncbi:MAG TPA: hypothetical protein DGT23_28315 [Micromonosporaceae bacterium]|nr:hypothetical protein [Micromonosporaceae bacterium]
MSEVTVPSGTSTETAAVAGRLRDQVIAGVLVVLALFILYVVFLDQGALLSPALGEAARSDNYIHEFTHDGRHLFAAACH